MSQNVAVVGRSAMHSYKQLEQYYHNALAVARSLPRPDLGEDLIIATSYSAKPAAWILYMGYLHGGHRALLLEPSMASMSVLPYRETGTVIVFHNEPRSLRIVNLAETASLLGLETIVVGPETHPAVRERLEYTGADIVTVSGDTPLLAMALYSLYLVPKLLGAREARYRRELEELDTALEWLFEKLGETLVVRLQNASDKQPYFTPVTYPGALYQCLSKRCGVPVPLEAAGIVGARGGIVYLSSVEEHDYKDILLSLRLYNKNTLLVRLDTDPVTAGLYSILAAILAGQNPI